MKKPFDLHAAEAIYYLSSLRGAQRRGNLKNITTGLRRSFQGLAMTVVGVSLCVNPVSLAISVVK